MGDDLYCDLSLFYVTGTQIAKFENLGSVKGYIFCNEWDNRKKTLVKTLNIFT